MAGRTFIDMMGREVYVNYPPKRIISIVPSQTELLFDLGLDDQVVGITKFCIHPRPWFRNKKRVGGTKTVHIDVVTELQPDLVIANKEENTKEQVEGLAAHYPVWISDIKSISDALQMIQRLGEITGTAEKAALLSKEIAGGFASLVRPATPKRVAYFIWRNPWMSVGGDTFINDMIATIGWQNVLAEKCRYPQVMLEELIDKQIDTVLLSSEPYPFKDTHIAEIKAVLPHVDVRLVDGEMFSWYGSRMKKATGYFNEMLRE